MISADDLWKLVKILNITVQFCYLNTGKRKRCLYAVSNCKTKTVFLDWTLLNNLNRLKCVLAEEIGHILLPPRPGHIRYHSRRFWEEENTGQIEAIVAQDERKALDWATGVLIPDVEFNRIIKDCCYSINEIAEFFGVETWFVEHKIDYYQRKQFEYYRYRVRTLAASRGNEDV